MVLCVGFSAQNKPFSLFLLLSRLLMCSWGYRPVLQTLLLQRRQLDQLITDRRPAPASLPHSQSLPQCQPPATRHRSGSASSVGDRPHSVEAQRSMDRDEREPTPEASTPEHHGHKDHDTGCLIT